MTEHDRADALDGASAPPGKGSSKAATTGPKMPKKKRSVVLDMGEASREEGFRKNGCR